MIPLKFRPASISDLDLLKFWDQQPHIIEAGANDWDWDKDLNESAEWRQQYIIEYDDRPIGFVQIMDPATPENNYWHPIPNNYKAIDIWIGEKEYLGRGIGTNIMEMAMDICFSDPMVEAIVIDPLSSNLRAIQFYKRLGFEHLEDRIMQGEEIYVMIRKRG